MSRTAKYRQIFEGAVSCWIGTWHDVDKFTCKDRVRRFDYLDPFILDRDTSDLAILGHNIVFCGEDKVLRNEETSSSHAVCGSIRTFDLGLYEDGVVAGVENEFLLDAFKTHTWNWLAGEERQSRGVEDIPLRTSFLNLRCLNVDDSRDAPDFTVDNYQPFFTKLPVAFYVSYISCRRNPAEQQEVLPTSSSSHIPKLAAADDENRDGRFPPI